MLITFLLKTVLLRHGITGVSLKFDTATETVQLSYALYGRLQVKKITFTELENLFTESNLGAVEAPPEDSLSVGRAAGGPGP